MIYYKFNLKIIAWVVIYKHLPVIHGHAQGLNKRFRISWVSTTSVWQTFYPGRPSKCLLYRRHLVAIIILSHQTWTRQWPLLTSLQTGGWDKVYRRKITWISRYPCLLCVNTVGYVVLHQREISWLQKVKTISEISIFHQPLSIIAFWIWMCTHVCK